MFNRSERREVMYSYENLKPSFDQICMYRASKKLRCILHNTLRLNKWSSYVNIRIIRFIAEVYIFVAFSN